MTKFPPLGRRACDGGNADGAYCRVDLADYVANANRERFVIFQIEDPEVLPDLEASDQCHIRDRVALRGVGDASLGAIETRCAIALRLAKYWIRCLSWAGHCRLGQRVTAPSCGFISSLSQAGQRLGSVIGVS